MSRRRALATLLLLAAGAAPAAAAPVPPRSAPERTRADKVSLGIRAPDPRLGERLDGRRPPERSHRLTLARAVFDPAREAIGVVFSPIVSATSWIEGKKLFPRVYWALTSDDGRVRLRPDIRYESGYVPALALGLRYTDERTLGPGSLLDVRGRTAGPGVVFGQLALQTPGVPLRLTTSWDRRNDAIFAGTIGLSRDDLADLGRRPARFGYDRGLVSLTTWFPVAGPLRVRLRGEADFRDYHDGVSRGNDPPIADVWCDAPGTAACTSVSPDLVPGFQEGTRLLRGGATLILDARPGRLGSGLVTTLDSSWTHGVIDDPSHHATFVGDATYYVGDLNRQLILRGQAGLVVRLGDAPVPIDELLSPSGTYGLRGLAPGRLRGQSELVGTVEYRWLISPFADASVFIDYGGAFGPHFTGIEADRLFPSVGLGMRFVSARHQPYWEAPPLAAIQVAWSPNEGTRFMLTTGF